MNQRVKILLVGAAVISLAILSGHFLTAKAAPSDATGPTYLSPREIVADKAGKTLYIAEATANQVAVFDIASGKVTKIIPIGQPVSGLVLSPDESKMYVTAGGADGKLCIVDVKGAKVEARIPVGHTPMSPVVSPDGKTVYLCNRFGYPGNLLSVGTVGIVDLAAGKQLKPIAVPREPTSLDIAKDGSILIVANHLPATASDQDYAASEVTFIDTVKKEVLKGEDGKVINIKLPNGAMALRCVKVSPDGKFAGVTHMLARFHLPTTQLERGWMNTNALSLIDVPNRKLVNTVLLDDVDHGAANPWAIAWSADSKTLCVSHAGTHEISVIDVTALLAKLDKAVTNKKGTEVQNDLSFLVGLRRRLKLAGVGPRCMTIVGKNAYVGEYFTDSLSVLDITPDARPVATPIPLGPKQELTVVRKGELFFNDARLCFQMWQCCATCHPDARTDGLNWDLMNDGMGNPKSSKSLLLAHKTPPSMITGIRKSAEVAVRAGIRFIQFAVRPEEDSVAIDEYLKSIKPIPSPFLVNGKLSDAAKRGKKLFDGDAGCSVCHSGPFFTDMEKHDIGTGKDSEAKKEFDTPGFAETWRTAPYLYDGRAVTMMDVFSKKHNPKDEHGETSGLSEQQKSDLATYVLSH